MSDKVHSHSTFGLRPRGKCPACDQVWADLDRRSLVKR